VHRQYEGVVRAIQQFEADILPQMYATAEHTTAPHNPNAPTAALLVNGFSGLGLATLIMVSRLFGAQFRKVIFVSIGEADSALLRSPEEVRQLEQQVADDLIEYYRLAQDLGLPRLPGPSDSRALKSGLYPLPGFVPIGQKILEPDIA
jgi:hypothetical protein